METSSKTIYVIYLNILCSKHLFHRKTGPPVTAILWWYHGWLWKEHHQKAEWISGKGRLKFSKKCFMLKASTKHKKKIRNVNLQWLHIDIWQWHAKYSTAILTWSNRQLNFCWVMQLWEENKSHCISSGCRARFVLDALWLGKQASL